MSVRAGGILRKDLHGRRAASCRSHVAGKDFLISKPITRVFGAPAPDSRSPWQFRNRALHDSQEAEIVRLPPAARRAPRAQCQNHHGRSGTSIALAVRRGDAPHSLPGLRAPRAQCQDDHGTWGIGNRTMSKKRRSCVMPARAPGRKGVDADQGDARRQDQHRSQINAVRIQLIQKSRQTARQCAEQRDQQIL